MHAAVHTDIPQVLKALGLEIGRIAKDLQKIELAVVNILGHAELGAANIDIQKFDSMTQELAALQWFLLDLALHTPEDYVVDVSLATRNINLSEMVKRLHSAAELETAAAGHEVEFF